MPLYYFHIYNDEITMDDEGTVLADEHAARALAVNGARSLVCENAMHGYLTRSHRIEIVDEHQNLVETIRFDEAVEIRE